MGYIGTAEQIEEQFVANFGRHVMSDVRHYANKPLLIEASVSRHFDRYEKAAKFDKEGNLVAKKTFENSTWKGFVDVPLSREAKEQYAAWDVADGDVWDGLAVYGEKGYKFSLVWSKNNLTWIATFTGTEGCGVNEGWAVTARARAPYDASRVLLFKVSVLMPDKWKDFKADPSDDIG
jgi:hypothetical protein